MFGLENLLHEKDIHHYLHREMFGGHGADIYPTYYVGYMSTGLRIRSDIDQIRIQPLRTTRIQPLRTNRIHEFFKDRIRIQKPLS